MCQRKAKTCGWIYLEVYKRLWLITESLAKLLLLSIRSSRVWGRHAPTRSLRKLARVWEVKSQWSTTFSRIENLWPRDGSCPLPLRSKPFLGNCFRIVKAQKISREFRCSCMLIAVHTERSSYPCFASALSGSLTESVRSWHGITFRRLMQDSRFSMKKAGRSADTTFCFFQTQE